MTPDLSTGVAIAITVGSIILIGLCLLCYCICNRADFERSSVNYQSRYPRHNYEALHDYDIENNEEPISYQQENGIPDGLENIDRECYMNSTIQALASSKKIIKQLNEAKLHIPFSESLRIILELIKGLNDNSQFKSVENNTALLKALIKEIKWENKSEQDTYEFLSAIVNAIHKEMKEANVEIESPLKIELKHKMFELNVPDKIEKHLGLSLGLCGDYKKPPGVTLDYLIKQHFSPTHIDEDSPKATQLFFCKQTPDVLLLHIQANKWDEANKQMIKQIYCIQYDEHLHLNLEIMMEADGDKISNEEVTYKLVAVIHHIGNYSGGHYVTFRKFEEKWILANDKLIEFVPFDPNICPYILIYEKL